MKTNFRSIYYEINQTEKERKYEEIKSFGCALALLMVAADVANAPTFVYADATVYSKTLQKDDAAPTNESMIFVHFTINEEEKG